MHRRILLWDRLHELFHYWHVIHKPFAVVMYLFMVVHIAVAAHDRLRVGRPVVMAARGRAPLGSRRWPWRSRRATAQISPGKLSRAPREARGQRPLPGLPRRGEGRRAGEVPGLPLPLAAAPRGRQGPARAARVPRLQDLPRRAPGGGVRPRLLGQGGARGLRPRADRPRARGQARAAACLRASATEERRPRLPRRTCWAGTCASCHADEHRGQFAGRDCASCHSQSGVEAGARLRPRADGLAARRGVTRAGRCEKCHATRRPDPASHGRPTACFRAVAAQGLRELPRGRARGPAGDRLHELPHHRRLEAGPWRPRASTTTQTGYPLPGRHAAVRLRRRATCPGRPLRVKHDALHGLPRATPTTASSRRAPTGGRCECCHDVSGFRPARFALEDHQKTAYPLAGAHLAVACDAATGRPSGCRRRRPWARHGRAVRVSASRPPAASTATPTRTGARSTRLRREGRLRGLPPRGLVARGDLRPRQTRFPLSGGHAKSPAPAATTRVDAGTPARALRFAGLRPGLRGLPQGPARGQFARAGGSVACERCHTTDDVKATRFDHDRDSAYALDGAHATARLRGLPPPGEARRRRRFVRYKPLAHDVQGLSRRRAARRKGGRA